MDWATIFGYVFLVLFVGSFYYVGWGMAWLYDKYEDWQIKRK